MTVGPLSPSQEWAASWYRAVHLYRHLVNGGIPDEVTTSLLLPPGEVAYCDLTLGYARYYGMDVTYRQSSGFFLGSPLFVAAGLAANAVGNSVARRRAEAQSMPQWREHSPA
ncbi:hypothetical protein AB0G02_33405, partial [Actinosynnema sp. NPDC023658]|uniref:hypothetical protein n=1 Tax=Actinosynnema sp. NPDC023658 TaxID=3155465 RepID=UPI0033F19ED7